MQNSSFGRTPSSARTGSSHRSTLEPRGLPAFDREYARQLSTAKRGRHHSTDGSTPLHSLDRHTTGYDATPPLHSTASTSSRIRNYVAWHVPSGYHGAPTLANSTTHSGDTGIEPSKLEMTQTFGPESSLGTVKGPADLSSIENSNGSIASLSLLSPSHVQGNTKLFVQTLLVVSLIMCVLLTTLSFCVSSSADYDPTYFSFSQPSGASSFSAGKRGWSDRFIPQLHRQMALRARRLVVNGLYEGGLTAPMETLGTTLASVASALSELAAQASPWLQEPLLRLLSFDYHTNSSSSSLSSQPIKTQDGSYSLVTGGLKMVRGAVFAVVHVAEWIIVEPISYIVQLGKSSALSVASFVASIHLPSFRERGNESMDVKVPPPQPSASWLWRAPWKTFQFLAGMFEDDVASNSAWPTKRDEHATIVSSTSPSKSTSTAKTNEERLLTVRTLHFHQVKGDEWSSILQNDADSLRLSVGEDLRALCGVGARLQKIEAGDDGLQIEFTVSQKMAVSSTEVGQQEAQQAIEAKLSRFTFPITEKHRRNWAMRRRAEEESQRSWCDKKLSGCAEESKKQVASLSAALQHCDIALAEHNKSWRIREAAAEEEFTTVRKGCTMELAACKESITVCQEGLRTAELLATEKATAVAAEARRVENELRDEYQGKLGDAQKACELSMQNQVNKGEIDCQSRMSAYQASTAAALSDTESNCSLRLQHASSEFAAAQRNILEDAQKECDAKMAAAAAMQGKTASEELTLLQNQLVELRAEADHRVSECHKAINTTQSLHDEAHQRLRLSCADSVSAEHQRCLAEVRSAREEEKAARLVAVSSTVEKYQKEWLAQCNAEKEAAVLSASNDQAAQCAAQRDGDAASCVARIATAVGQAEEQCNEVIHRGKMEVLEITNALQASRKEGESTIEAHRLQQKNAVAELLHNLLDQFELSCMELVGHQDERCSVERQRLMRELTLLGDNATAEAVLSRLTANSSESEPLETSFCTLGWSCSGLLNANTTESSCDAAAAASAWRARLKSFKETVLLIGFAAVSLYAAALHHRYGHLRRQNRILDNTVDDLLQKIPTASQGRKGVANANAAAALYERWLMLVLDCYSDTTASWHAMYCSALFEQDRNNLVRRQSEHIDSATWSYSCDAGRLSSPSDDFPSQNSRETSASLQPSTKHSDVATPVSPTQAAAVDDTDIMQLSRAVLEAYYSVLERYYIDLLDGFIRQKALECHNDDVERVSARQADVLKHQSEALSKLQLALTTKEEELQRAVGAHEKATIALQQLQHRIAVMRINEVSAHAAETPTSAVEKRNSTHNVVAQLQEQLEVAKDELAKARHERQMRDSGTPRSGIVSIVTTPSGAAVRSLQELASASMEGEEENQHYSQPSRRGRDANLGTATLMDGGSEVNSRTSSRRHTMVRNPDMTRRYRDPNWSD